MPTTVFAEGKGWHQKANNSAKKIGKIEWLTISDIAQNLSKLEVLTRDIISQI